jgi:hypothetical protein
MASEHLTKSPGEFGPEDIRPGMASFHGTGPLDKTCGDCVFRGYYRQVSTRKRDYPGDNGLRTVKVGGCEKFRQLTGRHGPVIQRDWHACKYFEKMSDVLAMR